MKKIFSAIGLISLICISFFISEKTVTVVKEVDDIMNNIKNNYINYEIKAIDAKILDNTIIPGLYGKKVNINKSYDRMKNIGNYNDKYYIYDKTKPEITMEKKYNKYVISGNPEKNMVSIIFTVYDNDDISKIEEILNKTKTKATFFINSAWLEQNNEKTINLIKEGHTIGNLSNNLDYEKTEYIWMNNIIKRIGKQKQNYCYSIEENEENLKQCTLQKNYTIRPSIVVKNSPLIEIKSQIKSGSLISFNINNKTNEELELVINYIKSKGYKIENLEKHLSEENNN